MKNIKCENFNKERRKNKSMFTITMEQNKFAACSQSKHLNLTSIFADQIFGTTEFGLRNSRAK